MLCKAMKEIHLLKSNTLPEEITTMTQTTISTDLETLRGQFRVMLFLLAAIALRWTAISQTPELPERAAHVSTAPVQLDLSITE
jgi:hypothetical protein